MNQDDDIGLMLKRYDPAQISYGRLGALEQRIMAAAMLRPQIAIDAEEFVPLSRPYMFRMTGLACMMLLLGMLTGQNVPVTTAESQHDLTTLAWAMPWQELAQN